MTPGRACVRLRAVPDSADSAPTQPAPVRAAAALLVLEGLAIIGYAGFQLTGASSGAATVAVSVGVFFLLYGAALLLAARGLWRLDGWSRGAAMATQLIQLGVAWSLRAQPTTAVAVVLAVAAVATMGCLLSRPATAAFDDQ